MVRLMYCNELIQLYLVSSMETLTGHLSMTVAYCVCARARTHTHTHTQGERWRKFSSLQVKIVFHVGRCVYRSLSYVTSVWGIWAEWWSLVGVGSRPSSAEQTDSITETFDDGPGRQWRLFQILSPPPARQWRLQRRTFVCIIFGVTPFW